MKLSLAKVAVAALFVSTVAFAQDGGAEAPPPPAPSPEEVKRVYDYFQDGAAGGPVLVDFKLCAKMDTDKNSPTVNECAQEITGPVKKGSQVTVWTHWFVPKGGRYEDVTVQVLLDGQVRETKDIAALQESWRARTWKASNVSKAGKWTFKLMRGGKELKSADVTVQ